MLNFQVLKSIFFNDAHFSNIVAVPVFFLMSQFDKLHVFKRKQLANILFVFHTFDVSHIDKSIALSERQPIKQSDKLEHSSVFIFSKPLKCVTHSKLSKNEFKVFGLHSATELSILQILGSLKPAHSGISTSL